MLYAKLIGRIALFTCENIALIEFYLQGLLPKILAIYTIKMFTVRTKNEKTALSNSFGLKSVFEKLRFRDELVLTQDLTEELKLCTEF